MPTSYRSAIQSFKRHARQGAETIARDVSKQIAESLVLKTPVDTGQARGNWEPAINTVPQEQFLGRVSVSGEESLTRARAIIDTLKLGNVFVMANSLDYIIPLEEGWSKQSPSGFRDLTAAAFQRMVEKAVLRNNAKA